MHCLVLGGAGFIGSHLVDALLAAGHAVRVFDVPNVNRQNLAQSINRIELVQGDFNNIRELSAALEGIHVVIHLVCTTLPQTSNENPAYDVQSNVVGTIHLLNEALRKGVQKIVFASSGGSVYGIPQVLPVPETHPTDPICSYGISKLVIEKYLAMFHHTHGLDYVVLRLGNPYGPRQRVDNIQGSVAVFLNKILRRQVISIWGNGSVARDYFHISDLVAAFRRAIEIDTASSIYNIAGGNAVSLNDLLQLIKDVTGIRPELKYERPRKFDVPASCLDIGRACRELGWQPQISLRDGIAETWQWLREWRPHT